MADNGTERRPIALLSQLKSLWQAIDELEDRPEGEGGPAPDPGDLEVYFENGLTGA